MGVDLPVFDVESEDDRCRRWEEWVARLERLLAIKTVTEDSLKVHYLFYFGGSDLERVYKENANTSDKYDQVKEKIGKHFKSKVNSKLNVLHFRDIFQHQGEPFDDFVNRLKDKAKSCAFAEVQQEISLQIIHRCQSTVLKRKALEAEKELTLDELIRYGRLDESVNSQMKELKKFNENENEKLEINKVVDNPGSNGNSSGRSSSRNNRDRQNTKVSYRQNDQNQSRKEKKCFKCGLKYPHEKICPAKGQKCRKCDRYDHFERCCPSNGKKVHKINERSDSESEGNGYAWRVRVKNLVMAVKDWFMPMVTVFLCGISLSFMVDTGAQVNIIDEQSFKKLKMKPKLYKFGSKLYGYGQNDCITTLGKFKTRLKNGNNYKSVEFVVTQGCQGNLLSYKTSVELGIMSRVNTIGNGRVNLDMNKWAEKYPALFSGKIGLLKDYEVKLHIDDSIKPIQQKLRPVPFHMRPLVEAEILKMIEQDVIEPVSGPTPWVSPIVPVPKPDRPNEVRICTDAREMNKAILRTRHSFPTVEDLVVKLNGAKYISKFDLRSGYNQLYLEKASRFITAFCTHMGVFQYKRLNFGVNAASEIFQKVIEQVLSGLEGVANFSDDIIVFASNKHEHDLRLEAVLRRLNDSGLTVNESKCEFGKQSLKFFGLEFSSNGISIESKNVMRF